MNSFCQSFLSWMVIPYEWYDNINNNDDDNNHNDNKNDDDKNDDNKND